MSVFKTGKGWRAKVFHNGRVVASMSGFPTKGAAREWHDEQRVLYDPRARKTERTFDTLLERYKADHLGKQSAGTRKRYLLEIDERIAPFFRYAPAQPSLDLLDDFRAHLGKTCKPRQANYCLSLLSSILERGVRWRYLERGHKFEPFPVTPKAYRWWDDRAHISRFLQMAKSRTRFYALYYLALATGMREGEIVGLAKHSIDFERGRIHVCRKWDWTARDFSLPKHDKTRWLDFDPKGDLAQVLREAVAASRHPELVFPSERGRPLSRSSFAEKVYKTIARDAGVPVLSFHSLRHCFASWYMREHDDVWALKEILGHADIQTTMRYAHHSEKLRKQGLDLASVMAAQVSPTVSRPQIVGL
jgi:integrase